MLNVTLRWACWILSGFLLAVGLLHWMGDGEPWISLLISGIGAVLAFAGSSIQRLQQQASSR